jgi:DNA-binding MarR family transcriptional regulator
LVQQEPIGLLVAVVRRRIKQVVIASLGTEKMSPQQFWMLVAIARQEGLSLRELAERQRMDQPTACRVVAELVRRRLVRSSTDPADRRRSRLHLTPTGNGVAEKLLPLARRIRETVESGLTAAERACVVDGLNKVIANLEQFEVESVPAQGKPARGRRRA